MREPDRIIRLRTVLARTGLSRSTIYRKIAEGTFPAQLKISANGTGWHESDINRWIADPVSWRPKREFDAGSVRSDSAPDRPIFTLLHAGVGGCIDKPFGRYHWQYKAWCSPVTRYAPTTPKQPTLRR